MVLAGKTTPLLERDINHSQLLQPVQSSTRIYTHGVKLKTLSYISVFFQETKIPKLSLNQAPAPTCGILACHSTPEPYPQAPPCEILNCYSISEPRRRQALPG